MEKLSVRLIVQDEALSSSLIPSCVFPSLLKTQRVLTADKIKFQNLLFLQIFFSERKLENEVNTIDYDNQRATSTLEISMYCSNATNGAMSSLL